MADVQSADQRLTREKLWRNTVEYCGKVLPGDTDMKTFNEVVVKVYEQMKFLVAGEKP